jgi:butyryl-CoA dehydrogenase
MLLSQDQILIQETAHTLATKVVRPLSPTWEKEKQFPFEALKELASFGFMGMLLPEKWGGADLDTLSYLLVIMEMAKADGGLSTILSVHNSVASLPILHFGNETQQAEFLPHLAKGEWLGAFCLSEPGAGSDARAIQTKAFKKDNYFILNGVKQFITSGGQAKIAIVFARTPSLHEKNSLSSFIVPTNTPGFVVAKIENKMGQHSAEIAQIVLDNVKIPENYLLGEIGDGYKIALSNLECGRLGIAAQAIGMAEEALALSIKYSKERKTFGQFLCQHQAIGFKLADMATQCEAAKQLLFHAAVLRENKLPALKAVSMAKLFATEMAEKVCHDALQIYGGYGYLEDFPLAKIYRDVRATTIYEGSSEIQRHIISKEL